MKKTDKKDSLFATLMGLFWAFLIALAIRSVIFEPYHIPSSSMVPTLLIGDYLFVSKYDYGYSRHAFPLSLPLVPRGRLFGREAQRGDVVIFKTPTDNSTDYIKRIVGLPGDRIQVSGGRLFINDQPTERRLLGEEEWRTETGLHRYRRYLETLPNGVSHHIYELSDTMMLDDTQTFLIPQGYYFMMGDNRDNSSDSRVFGPVPAENLKGKARFIFYSNNGSGWFLEFWKWNGMLRFERFFTEIK